MPEPLNNFTPRAQQALALARKEAERLHHDHVGTEHLLLGLINLGQGVAVNVLRQLGLELDRVRSAVRTVVGPGSDAKPAGNAPYTPRVKKVLVLAGEEAKDLNHTYIGTEHLLLGILREGEGVAVRVLKSLDVDLERCRMLLWSELDPNSGAKGDAAAAVAPSPKPVAPSSLGLGFFDGLMRWLRGGKPKAMMASSIERARSGPARTLSMNFTPRAQQVLALSRKEADRFGHNYVGTEHLLLGLIALERGVAAKILPKLGLDLERVRTMVEKQIGPGLDHRAVVGGIPYTPRVKKVLALAGQEAKALNHTYLGTEHILLGLIAEGEGVAARVLKDCNVNLEQCRAEILAELGKAASPLVNERTFAMGSAAHRTSYTAHAAQALDLARREADWFHHRYVDTEHLLLALLSQRDDIALGLLQMMGVEAEAVAGELQKHLAPGVEAGPPVSLEATPKFKRAMNLAIEEARALQHPKVGLKHILLGLLREGDGIAARVLTNLRIDYTVLRGLCAISPEN